MTKRDSWFGAPFLLTARTVADYPLSIFMEHMERLPSMLNLTFLPHNREEIVKLRMQCVL